MLRFTEEDLLAFQRRQSLTKETLARRLNLVQEVIEEEKKGKVRGEKKKPLTQPHEDEEQVTLARWLDYKQLHWWHTPNGGMRNVIVAKKLKAQGVKSGVPDIIILETPPKYPDSPGVAIELKRQHGGVVSDNQKEWLGWFESRGWCCCVAKGAEEAINFLISLGF